MPSTTPEETPASAISARGRDQVAIMGLNGAPAGVGLQKHGGEARESKDALALDWQRDCILPSAGDRRQTLAIRSQTV